MKKLLSTLFTALSLLACTQEQKATTETAFSLSPTLQKRLRLATANAEEVQSELQLTGKVSAYEEKLVKVSPLVDGLIVNLNANLGDRVAKGQALAIIKSADAASAESDQNDAISTLKNNEKNLAVTKDMARLGLSAEKDVVLAENEVKRASGGVRRAEEITSLYGIRNSLYTLKAPISGYVIEKNPNISNQLSYDNAQTGPFFTIADLSVVQVWADIYEADIAKIKIGEEVEVKVLALPSKIFRGKIDKIQDLIDPTTRTMKARISIQNADILLKPEMFAQIKVSFDEGLQEVSVPNDAVIFDNNRNYVVVYHSATNLEKREVQIYQRVGEKVFIQSGLKANEKVLLSDQLIVFNAL